MTKREICERLMDIYDNLDEAALKGRTCEEIRDLLLDLAEPETKKEKKPLLLIYEENGEKAPCPVCGAPSAPIKNKPGVFLCKRCGGLVCSKEGEQYA